MKKKFTIKQLCITAICMALTCLATMLIQIPIPLGYAHLRDSLILITSFFFGPVVGCLAGGIGSMMADILTGFPIWAIPTLIIKSIMPLIFIKFQKYCGSVLSLLFMVAGYTIFGCIIAGNVAAGLASAPGLLLKAAVNFVVYLVLTKALTSAGLKRLLASE